MKQTILVILALTVFHGLYSEELTTERIRFGRMGGFIMNAGYIKHFSDKYPILLNEEFRKEVKLAIPPPEVFTHSEKSFSDRVLDPALGRCVSNNSEEIRIAVARYVRIFELHGAPFTSIDGARLEIDMGRFEFKVTNTRENIAMTRKLFRDFSKYYYNHRYDENPIPISMKIGDPFGNTNE